MFKFTVIVKGLDAFKRTNHNLKKEHPTKLDSKIKIRKIIGCLDITSHVTW